MEIKSDGFESLTKLRCHLQLQALTKPRGFPRALTGFKQGSELLLVQQAKFEPYNFSSPSPSPVPEKDSEKIPKIKNLKKHFLKILFESSKKNLEIVLKNSRSTKKLKQF